jgi:glycosyltransferase involved in cell wall biosynthesis
MIDSEPECSLTILMPCLNEAETLSACIKKAQGSIIRLGVRAEILVADNGSIDGSQDIARMLGARVIQVKERGYGAALRAGIFAASGKYIIMGDADDSYAFDALEEFYCKLESGRQLVMGNRFRGGISAGAMPPLHRYLGNPVLSFIGRLLFRIPIGDFHCGLRGFHRDAVLKLRLQTSGMEFASEMVIKSAMAGLNICEVPTTLKPDGRSRPPHLRSWRDGWRHLRFMLLHSPRWLFIYPGVFLLLLGFFGSFWVLPELRVVTGVGFDIHSLLYFTAIGLVGMQLVFFGLLARCSGVRLGFLPSTPITRWMLEKFRLEFGLLFAFGLLIASGILAWRTFSGWETSGFSALDPRETMRLAIPAAALAISGMEILSTSFWITFLQFAPKAEYEQ